MNTINPQLPLQSKQALPQKISQQYCDLKFIVSEKVESGMIKSFTDMLKLHA